MGVAQHQAVLGTAVYRGRDERSCINLQISVVGHSKRNSLVVSDGVGFAATSGKDITPVIVILRVGHFRLIDTAHYSTINDHRDQTSTRGAGFGDVNRLCRASLNFRISGINHLVKRRKGTHRAQFAAAIDTAFHLAAYHSDRGIAFYQARLFVGLGTLSTTIDRTLDDAVVDGHRGVVDGGVFAHSLVLHVTQTAAAIDVAFDGDLCRCDAAGEQQSQGEKHFSF